MGFETIGEIKRENEEAERLASKTPPAACPICGNVLQVRARVRNCPTGDYRYEG